MIDEQTLLDEDQAAAMLNVSKRTLRRFRQKGKGPRFNKIGGKVRYRRSSIEEWLRNNETMESGDFYEAPQDY